MTTATRPSDATSRSDELFANLLYAVSHDLRSPLLSLSLSAELIKESVRPESADQTALVAVDALQHGAKDMERMLHALQALSRALRRPLEVRAAPLRMLLGGHIVVSEAELERVAVTADPRVVREVLDALGETLTVHVRVGPDTVVLLAEPAEPLPELEGSPLEAVVQSLQAHAGTLVEQLAAFELTLGRQDAALGVERGRVALTLRRADPIS